MKKAWGVGAVVFFLAFANLATAETLFNGHEDVEYLTRVDVQTNFIIHEDQPAAFYTAFIEESLSFDEAIHVNIYDGRIYISGTLVFGDNNMCLCNLWGMGNITVRVTNIRQDGSQSVQEQSFNFEQIKR